MNHEGRSRILFDWKFIEWNLQKLFQGTYIVLTDDELEFFKLGLLEEIGCDSSCYIHLHDCLLSLGCFEGWKSLVLVTDMRIFKVIVSVSCENFIKKIRLLLNIDLWCLEINFGAHESVSCHITVTRVKCFSF